jgi:hypothetical protein
VKPRRSQIQRRQYMKLFRYVAFLVCLTVLGIYQSTQDNSNAFFMRQSVVNALPSKLGPTASGSDFWAWINGYARLRRRRRPRSCGARLGSHGRRCCRTFADVVYGETSFFTDDNPTVKTTRKVRVSRRERVAAALTSG